MQINWFVDVTYRRVLYFITRMSKYLTMAIIKKKDCFIQKRKVKGHWLSPILLEVIDIIENREGYRGIYKVRWHVMSRDKVYTSIFLMATIKDGEFADFVPMSRELFLECVEILRKREIYSNARKQVMYRMNKVLANREVTR